MKNPFELVTLKTASDQQLVEEMQHRGLVHSVKTRDIVEMAWAVRNNNPALLKGIVLRLAREHLGKVL